MASSDRIVALNIGTQRVSAAVFGKTKKGLTLNKFDTRSILADPSAENVRAAEIAQCIAELVSSMKLAKSPVYYALPGYSVFVRFIKLPPIDDGDIPQLVKFEAQQHIPFPLDEVIWSYHMLPDSGLEKEAVLIAIKTDLLNEIDSSITNAGLKTAGVDSAPSALYNAFRNSYPDLMESTLLIDIGTKTSDLIYAENGKFFTRSISMGGSSITAAIAREYGISFAEAENLKLSKGLVALSGGHTSSMDEDTARLASSIRNALTRLVSEIPRTTNHYRSQFGGSPPQHVFLCGGGAALSYAKEFIQERLQVPVQFFNPLHNISVGSSINTDEIARNAYLMGELIGLGLKGIDREEIKIDLVPTKVAKLRIERKKRPLVIAGMLALIAGAGIFAWGAHTGEEKARVQLDTESRVWDKAKSIQSRIDATTATERGIDAKRQEYEKLTFSRFAYADVLKEFVEKAKNDSYWIVEFDPIIGFDPSNSDSIETGISAISKSFRTDKTISVTKPDPSEVSTGSRRGAANDKPEVPAVNAIRVRGLVRMDKGGFENAEWIRKQLEGDSENSLFTFSVGDTPLEARQIIQFEEKPADKDAFAKPFTMVLPLKNPIPVE